MNDDLYARLAAPFDYTFTDNRGGINLTYVTGEQVASRLNEILGVTGWSFQVVAHGYIEDTDEEWCQGRLTVYGGVEPIIREQFGSQRRNRKRDGSHIEIGMDMKGATTDAMKKCASLIGVGLYLSHKEAPAQQRRAAPPPTSERPQRTLVPHVCSVCGDTNLGGGGMRQGKDYCRAHWNDTP